MIFVVPSPDEKYAKGVFQPLVHQAFPFGTAALASVVERDGVSVKIINDGINRLNRETIQKLAKAEKGRPVFGLTSLTLQAQRAKEIRRMIKEVIPDAAIIVGGIHATCMPQEFLDDGFGYIFVGEGELFITDLVCRLSEDKDVSDIPGLIWKNSRGDVKTNYPLREFVKLGELPLFPFHLFHEDIHHYDLGVVMSSRGCPYKCIFCSQRAMTGLTYRMRPIDMVLDEIDIVVNKYNAKHIYFIEDNFVVNKQRTIELCDRLIEKGLNKKATFLCQLRGDAASSEVLAKLAQAGCETVFLGIETGSERMAKIIQKGETVEANCQAVYLAKKYGLKVSATFIIGFPQETAKEREETIRLALKLPLDALRVNVAIPYPGTPMYEMAKERLHITEGWSNFNVVSSLVTGPFSALPLPYIPEGATEEELRFLSMWANLKFWLRPSGIKKFFTISSTGVTRLPSLWYSNPKFLIRLIKMAGSIILLVGWITVLGVKYNLNKFSRRVKFNKNILLVDVLKRDYKNFVSKFILSNGWGKLKLVKLVLWYVPLLFLWGIISPIIVVILRLLRPIVRIRIGKLVDGRIGHLASNTDLYLRRRVQREKIGREFHVFVSGKPANRQLFTMIKRRVFVVENQILAKLYSKLESDINASDEWISLPYNGNEFEELNSVPSQLWFTKEEEVRGKELLEDMGIKNGVSFVCFHARDKAYLNVVHPRYSSQFWSYHDYRDADIQSYVPAAEYLTLLGVTAVRVGSIVERPIESNNPKVIDYSTHYRSDFMDVYLLAKCKFLLADTAGIQCVSQMFDVPIAAVNWIPIKFTRVGRRDLFIPKKLWSVDKKQFLSFREIIVAGIDNFIQTEDYKAVGVEVVNNTADEILALVKEMNARIDGSWISREEDEELQQRYRNIFPSYHHSYGFPSRIGTEFLRQNRELIG